MKRPPATTGMHHVALLVPDLEACERFYCELLGMRVEWRPDKDNVYLSSGDDNLALHRAGSREDLAGSQRLDHIGFSTAMPEHVDAWYSFLHDHGVKMKTEPRNHRDGARSFYCWDPAGTVVQIIHHLPLAGVERK